MTRVIYLESKARYTPMYMKCHNLITRFLQAGLVLPTYNFMRYLEAPHDVGFSVASLEMPRPLNN